jgi:hypothetical protein
MLERDKPQARYRPSDPPYIEVPVISYIEVPSISRFPIFRCVISKGSQVLNFLIPRLPIPYILT